MIGFPLISCPVGCLIVSHQSTRWVVVGQQKKPEATVNAPKKKKAERGRVYCKEKRKFQALIFLLPTTTALIVADEMTTEGGIAGNGWM